MAVNQYYLATSAYAYPSANAENGGEDNTENNLRIITDKFAIKSFVVKRPNDVSDDYFNLSGTSSEPYGVNITGGECSINGYYLNLQSIFVATSGLSPSTEYHVLVRLYKTGSGELNGIGTITSGDSNVYCLGVGISIVTEDEMSSLDPNLYLDLGYFDTDDSGNPPSGSSGYTLTVNRYAYIDMTTIVSEDGETLEQWVITNINNAIAKVDKISYYANPDDSEPTSTLQITSEGLIYTNGDTEINILEELDKIPQLAPSGQYTTMTIPEAVLQDNVNTYNGISSLVARADHNHDDRYIHRKTNASTQNISSGLSVTGELFGSSIEFSNSLFSDNNAFSVEGISGNLTTTGTITGSRVYNAVWNDYADALLRKQGSEVEPGDIVCKTKGQLTYEKSSYSNSTLVVGVCTDTYGHLLGGDPNKTHDENLKEYVPVAVAGNVRCKVFCPVSEGDLITVSNLGDGVGEPVSRNKYLPGTIVGKALESCDKYGVYRVLIQVMLM